MSLTGPGNNLLAIFGGIPGASAPPTPDGNSLYTYDTSTKAWTAATLRDPPRRQHHSAVAKLGDGSMYFFGGTILDGSANGTGTPTFDLWALGRPLIDNSTSSTPGLTPRSSSWEQLANPSASLATGSSNIGSSRTGHTATILRSNGLMVVIGGVIDGGVLASMSDILVYDTTSGKWSLQIATGATPPPRMRHSAAATKDGMIYVHGGSDLGLTNYLSDVAILDTSSWTWLQPAFEGTAPTGRHSHTATTVGSNILFTFGLTAGGAVDTVSVLDTTTNTWQYAYTPNNLAFTSTKPEDWPGYQPPPNTPISTNPPAIDPGRESENGRSPLLAPILGSVFGVICASLVVLAVVRHRRRIHNQKRPRPIDTSFYGAPYSASMWEELDRAYAPMGLGFEQPPRNIQERIRHQFSSASAAISGLWSRRMAGGGGGKTGRGWGWRRNRKDRSHVFRILDRDPDGSLRPRGPGAPSTAMDFDPMNNLVPTDQELFLDAVKRARSRGGMDAPVFAPLQPPLSPTSPNKPMSFQFPPTTERDDAHGPVEYHGPGEYRGSPTASSTSNNRMSVGAGSLAGSDGAYGEGSGSSYAGVGGAGPYHDPSEPYQSQVHGRTYSDGFENSMAIMDVQMVSVPRGRLFVVNPSEEEIEPVMDREEEGTDRQELEPLHSPGKGKSHAGDTRYVHFESGGPSTST
ncbi:Kelch domain-containing protein 2 [Actinomortierella ambigua]|nr:Kelch domain-containing protein 2 [Actinomortierella ambigua]